VAFTYEPAKVPTEALHWVRFKVGATKDDASPKLDDDEVTGALVLNGLTALSPIIDGNRVPLHQAAASVCRSIAAAFARQGAVVAPAGSGSPKNVSAETYLKLALQLEAEGAGVLVVGGQVVETAEVPYESVDSVDYRRDRFGGDHSEYVGDEVT
jgi:hypothetical protein